MEQQDLNRLQKIFNIAISNRYLNYDWYMCNALNDPEISAEDRIFAKNCIQDYIGSTDCEQPTLIDYLKDDTGRTTLAKIESYCLPIYKDWANRPPLTHQKLAPLVSVKDSMQYSHFYHWLKMNKKQDYSIEVLKEYLSEFNMPAISGDRKEKQLTALRYIGHHYYLKEVRNAKESI